MESLPFVHAESTALELCLRDLRITNLTEPVLKFIHFKAKCRMNRLKDKLEWEEYCLKNNIHLPQTASSLTMTKHPKQTQTDQSTRSQTREKLIIKRKSVSIQTINVKNKTVQVKMKDIPHLNSQAVKSPSKKRENVKPTVSTDCLKMSPTMLKLENQIFEKLINDVKCQMETIALKNKLEEMKMKENKLKGVRKQIQKLEEKSKKSNSFKSDDLSSGSVSRKPLRLSIDNEKYEIITQLNSRAPKMPLKIPGLTSELLDELADDLLRENLQSVTQEVVEIVDYVATVSYQEEVELF